MFTSKVSFPARSVNIFSLLLMMLPFVSTSCGTKDKESGDEQIRVETIAEESNLDTANAISGNLSLAQIPSYPNIVVLTGLAQHRLVTIYKTRKTGSDGILSKRYYYDEDDDGREIHYMPGIDLIYGYNMLNIAHYDLTTEKLNYLFDHPVLVKSLYYPSYEQDSLDKKPINRDYYLVSTYDEDTNGDTLINKTDLRRFYAFNASCTEKIQIIPPDYSVERSQYDAMNDIMYVFARQDADRNGETDKKEPVHIYWITLKKPGKGKRLY
jgi:hypothetical protein